VSNKSEDSEEEKKKDSEEHHFGASIDRLRSFPVADPLQNKAPIRDTETGEREMRQRGNPRAQSGMATQLPSQEFSARNLVEISVYEMSLFISTILVEMSVNDMHLFPVSFQDLQTRKHGLDISPGGANTSSATHPQSEKYTGFLS